MSITLAGFMVCAAGLLPGRNAPLYVLMVCCLFGATAAVVLTSLGGATMVPAALFLPFLVARAFVRQGVSGFVRQVEFPGAGFWLLMLTAWGVISAYFMPRLFQDEVVVRSVDRAADFGASMVALQPVTGNFTQSGYALGALVTFVAVRTLVEGASGARHFRNAVLLLAALNVLAGMINLAEAYAGLPRMLANVRTAQYVMFEGDQVGGLTRLSGTFSEAAVFSAFTLALFAFTLMSFLQDTRRLLAGALAAASLGLLLLSTSTTAYVGLAAYAALLAVYFGYKAFVLGQTRARSVVLVGLLAGVGLAAFFLVKGDAAASALEFLRTAVFEKMHTPSGVDRSSWNQQAWSNFLETYGAGVGLGSVHASSYPLVLLSNVGVAGTLLFLAFIASLVGMRDSEIMPASSASIRAPALHALLASLIAATLSARVFDLGILFYAFAAAAARPAVARPRAPTASLHAA